MDLGHRQGRGLTVNVSVDRLEQEQVAELGELLVRLWKWVERARLLVIDAAGREAAGKELGVDVELVLEADTG